MERKYGIKEVSDLLQISSPTIRYWDKERLIRTERNNRNDYREFTVPGIIEIANIALYRSMDIPVKKIREMKQAQVLDQEKFLQKAHEDIERKIEELKRQRKMIDLQKYFLKELSRLRQINFGLSVPVFASMKPFEEENKEHWISTIRNPQRTGLVIGSGQVEYCIGSREVQEGSVWIRKENTHCYVEFLLIASAEAEEDNNLAQQLAVIQKEGFTAGTVIAQYLASGYDKEIKDYYRAWAEIPRKAAE